MAAYCLIRVVWVLRFLIAVCIHSILPASFQITIPRGNRHLIEVPGCAMGWVGRLEIARPSPFHSLLYWLIRAPSPARLFGPSHGMLGVIRPNPRNVFHLNVAFK